MSTIAPLKNTADSLETQLVNRLCNTLASYLDTKQVAQCMRAYEFGATAHTGQFRKSGEPYICHPIAVAINLAEMRMDADGITAAILHDVIEDTGVSKQELATQFNNEVAELVDGVTKLSKIDNKSRAEAQGENVRKMFLAMAKDLRVIIVKLADRLHNMETLGVMQPHKKRRIARETLDIYAPIANRLGMNTIRHKLEGLSFEAMYPFRYAVLSSNIKKARGNRRKMIDTIENTIRTRLQEAPFPCDVVGREKNIYSIYKKMVKKKIPLADVFDVYAFRIYCDDVDACYRILGMMHNLYKPIPGRFKDYIALPKENGYQSLHSVLMTISLILSQMVINLCIPHYLVLTVCQLRYKLELTKCTVCPNQALPLIGSINPILIKHETSKPLLMSGLKIYSKFKKVQAIHSNLSIT